MHRLVCTTEIGDGFKRTQNCITGAFAAGFSTFATAPFDTIKTRRQLQPNLYTGSLQAARAIFIEEGFAGFFRGVTLRCTRKAASSGIAWSLVSIISNAISFPAADIVVQYEGLMRRWS